MNKKVLAFALVLSMVFGMMPLAGPKSYAADELRVQIGANDTNATTDQIGFTAKIYNSSGSDIDLADIKLRYYYTREGNQAQSFYCDYAACGMNTLTEKVNGDFHSMATPTADADHYLEISFDSGSGTIATGTNAEIHSRIAKSDWSNYTQTNDYSFTNSSSAQDWTKVTAYVNGIKKWGMEPVSVTPPVVSSIFPTGTDVSPATNTLILSFGETVTASTPAIEISDGTNTFTSSAISAAVSGTGTNCKAKFALTSLSHGGDALLLDHGKTYTVMVEEGAFMDVSGDPIANGTVGTFTTKENLAGGGTELNPYRILSLEDLENINALDLEAGCCYRLMNDITDPVTAPLGAFGYLNGAFDGGGHTIAVNIDGQGLFPEIGTEGVVKNLNISGTVANSSRAGGLAGSSAGTIINCYADVDVTGVDKAGGLVGENYYGQITGSGAGGNVTCAETAENALVFSGGLAGINTNGTIESCYAEGNVTGTSIGNNSSNAFVGGLVGENDGAIENSYSSGSVYGSSESAFPPEVCYVGGLVGDNYSGSVINCYSAGYATGAAVGGSLKAGGLAGYNHDTVEHSYYNDTLNSLSVASGSSSGITGISSFDSDMEDFADQLSNYSSMTGTGYGFEISAGENNGYPVIISYIPSVSISSDSIKKGETGSFTVDFGDGAATGASIVSDDTSVVSVDIDQVTSEAVEVTYTGTGKGSADITVTFNDKAQTVQTITITVKSSNSGNHHHNDSSQNEQEPGAQDETNSGNAPDYGDIINHWAKASIEFVVGKGLFLGTGNGVFNPDKPMSRGMLVTVLGRLFEVDNGKLDLENGKNFRDVASNKYYSNYISWATRNGIATGTGTDRFMPDSSITREQLILMLYNYAKFNGWDISAAGTGTGRYSDSDQISTWAGPAMDWAVNTGIISGNENGELNPKAGATRAEVAAILQRFIEK